MTTQIEYQAGVAAGIITHDASFIEFDCGPMQSGRILKSDITAVGLQDPGSVMIKQSVKEIHRFLGTEGALGGLMIAHRKNGTSKIGFSTITLDFGNKVCLDFIDSFTAEMGDRFIGVGSRGVLMKQMGINRAKENLLIAAIILIGIIAAGIMAFR